MVIGFDTLGNLSHFDGFTWIILISQAKKSKKSFIIFQLYLKEAMRMDKFRQINYAFSF